MATTGAWIGESGPPFLTADQRGVGGNIKCYNEDFFVEEVPLYEPCGEGTHVYFMIEKQGLATLAAIRMIAHALGRKPHEIGYAGMKDAHAVTRQMLSLEHVDPSAIERLDLARIRVLSIARHRNKLKLGHLRGNRFVIKLRFSEECTRPIGGEAPRGLPAGSTCESGLSALREQAEAIMRTLARRGVPNYFGPQRFGSRGDNARIGLAVVLGDFGEAIALILGRPGPADSGDIRRARERFDAGDLRGCAEAWPRFANEQRRLAVALARAGGDAGKAWRSCDHTLRKLYGSALQSELFNQVLAARLLKKQPSGAPLHIADVDAVEEGDLAWLHRNGASFRVEDVEREQPRCTTFEISPTGPLFGRRMTEPAGQPGALEDAVLADASLQREQIRSVQGTRLDGARRPLRVPLVDWAVDAGSDERDAFLALRFLLPPGAYATNVVREIAKSGTDSNFNTSLSQEN